MKTPPSSMAIVLVASFIGSFGAVFLKAGAERLHRDFWNVVYNWRLAIGVTFFMGSSLLYMKGIKNGELTVLYPMVSLGYVWTLLWARIFFGEPLTRGKFAGLGLILFGIVLLAFGNR
jgi:undecaprenyl phosphate-alpha-L-ara4N flippase subunit ArnE